MLKSVNRLGSGISGVVSGIVGGKTESNGFSNNEKIWLIKWTLESEHRITPSSQDKEKNQDNSQ